MLHAEWDTRRHCCHAMSQCSGMAHVAMRCNKTNYACLPTCLIKEVYAQVICRVHIFNCILNYTRHVGRHTLLEGAIKPTLSDCLLASYTALSAGVQDLSGNHHMSSAMHQSVHAACVSGLHWDLSMQRKLKKALASESFQRFANLWQLQWEIAANACHRVPFESSLPSNHWETIALGFVQKTCSCIALKNPELS